MGQFELVEKGIPMSIRDPRVEPVPGDVFQTGTGVLRTVIDSFVSTGTKPGSETPGFYVEERTKDGIIRTGTVARAVLCSKIRKAAIVKQADLPPTQWSDVPRHPHAEVTEIMRRKHQRTT